MAQIRHTGGNSYQIAVFLGFGPDGKKKFKYTTYHPLASSPAAVNKEVRRFAAEYEEQVKSGGVLGGDKITVLDFAEKVWRPWMDDQRNKPLTRMAYEGILRAHVYPEIGNMRMSKVTPLNIQAIVDRMREQDLSISAMKNAVGAASSIFSCALKKHVIDFNPCDARRIDYPDKKRKSNDNLHYFTAAQAQRFLDALGQPMVVEHPAIKRKNGRVIPAWKELKTYDPQWQVYFYLAIFGGFRRGELVPLKWSDINFKKQTIRIDRAARQINGETYIKPPKSDAGFREISLPQICFVKLRELHASRKVIAPDGWIFVRSDGANMIGISSPTHFFKKFLDDYNAAHPDDPLPLIRLHDLRHTQATLLLAYGVDIETVRKRMGHSRASVTLDIYGHAIEELDRSAAAALEKALGVGKS